MNPWNTPGGWSQIPPGYSQPQQAYTGHWQQQQPAWTEHKEGFFHLDRFTSNTRKYPSLHPILAIDTTLARVDVRFEPSSQAAISNATYYAYRHAHATVTQASHIRLISKIFPWSIDIKTPGHPVTCDDVWNALYAALQQPLADSEWGALSHDSSKARKVQKSAKQRQTEIDKDKNGLKRVDWVADSYIFRGLEKDDEFAKRRLAYIDGECDETWLVKMVPP